MKIFVINRKNFIFSKIEREAEASAMMKKVIRKALAKGMSPRKYIQWVL